MTVLAVLAVRANGWPYGPRARENYDARFGDFQGRALNELRRTENANFHQS